MNFFKSSYFSAISTTISIITKLIVNKIMAVFIGPSGFAIFGQFKDFNQLTIVLSQLGTENGVIKYTSETKENLEDFKTFINTAFKVHLFGALISCIGIYFFKDSISKLLFEDNGYSFYLVIIGVSLVFVSLNNLILSIFNGFQILKKYLIASILTTIITALVTVISVSYFQLNGLIISLAINNAIVLLISASFLFKLKIINFSIITRSFSKTYFKKLLNFSLMSISGMVSMSLSLLFIRSHAINTLGVDSAGIWDAVWRISALYLLFLTSSFKFYILPTFSKLKNNILIKKEILQIWKVTFPSIIIITGGIYLLKDFIINLLFSPEFLLIGSIILFQLLGDIVRIHSWTLGNLLIAKSKTKNFVTLQIIWGIIFCTSAMLLIIPYGLKGITLAYFITCVIHFLLLNFSLRNIIWNLKSY